MKGRIKGTELHSAQSRVSLSLSLYLFFSQMYAPGPLSRLSTTLPYFFSHFCQSMHCNDDDEE